MVIKRQWRRKLDARTRAAERRYPAQGVSHAAADAAAFFIFFECIGTKPPSGMTRRPGGTGLN